MSTLEQKHLLIVCLILQNYEYSYFSEDYAATVRSISGLVNWQTEVQVSVFQWTLLTTYCSRAAQHMKTFFTIDQQV